jgi:hypothetical protein
MLLDVSIDAQLRGTRVFNRLGRCAVPVDEIEDLSSCVGIGLPRRLCSGHLRKDARERLRLELRLPVVA